MDIPFSIAFGLLGLMVGSFLNVCIDRLPRGESILHPASHCQACHHRLAARDLVPLFSYLRLRGRCRYCQAAIPGRLPWLELATGALFAFLCWHFGLTAELGAMTFYACLFIVVFAVDLEHGLILNRVLYVGTAAALLFALFLPLPWLAFWRVSGIASAAIGAGIGFVILFLIAVLSRGGMGWGDVKLAALIGLATGFPLVFVALFVAAILGGVVGVALLITKKRGRKQTVPFGPFLSVGTMITLLWGSSILSWYLGLM